MPHTTGSQRKRFSILKNLVLQGRKAARVDGFVALMKDHFVTVEKDYVATHFRTLKGHFFKASTTATRPLQETWAKKERKVIDKKVLQLGKYQQSPCNSIRNLNAVTGTKLARKSIKTANNGKQLSGVVSVTSDIVLQYCPMNNIMYNCWFNSVIQAFANTLAVTEIIDSFVVECDNDTAMYNLHFWRVFHIFLHTRINAPKSIPDSVLQKALDLYFGVFGTKSPAVGTFQDVHECISNVFGSLFTKFNLLVSVKHVVICNNCNRQLSNTGHTSYDSILLSLPLYAQHNCGVTLQNMVDLWLQFKQIDGKCDSHSCTALSNSDQSFCSFAANYCFRD